MDRKITRYALALCLLLAACGGPAAREQSGGEAVPLDHLSIEVVVDREESGRLRPSLDRLSGQLAADLLERGCAAEEIEVTFSTAGTCTGTALAAGGVDVACMPEADYAACGACGSTVLIALGGEPAVVAVAEGRPELDGTFREALAGAMQAENGFLALCYPGTDYGVPGEDQSLWEEEDSRGA